MRQLGDFIEEGGTFHVVDPRRLSQSETDSILDAMQWSVSTDYPDRSAEEIAYYMQHTAANFAQTVPVPGNPFTHEKQTFYNRRLIIAERAGVVHAMLATDDNISGHYEGSAGERERALKYGIGTHILGWKRYVYRRVGQRAVSTRLHGELEGQAFDPDELTVLDGMGYIGFTLAGSPQEQVSAYPHGGELQWEDTLKSWGLNYFAGDDQLHATEPRWIFGSPPARAVIQRVMRGSRVEDAMQHIERKRRAQRFLVTAVTLTTYHAS